MDWFRSSSSNNNDVQLNKIQSDDVEFYEELLSKCKESLKTPMMTRRADVQKDDPTDELIDVHIDIQNMEREFRECVEIGTFLLKKNREMEKDSNRLQTQLNRETMQHMSEVQSEVDLTHTVRDQSQKLQAEKEKKKQLK
jgi:hypothetical protein